MYFVYYDYHILVTSSDLKCLFAIASNNFSCEASSLKLNVTSVLFVYLSPWSYLVVFLNKYLLWVCKLTLIENVSVYSVFPEQCLGFKIQHFILSVLRYLLSCFNNLEIRMSLSVTAYSLTAFFFPFSSI